MCEDTEFTPILWF